MNEIFFFFHIFFVFVFVLGFLRLGAPALTALIVLEALFANLFVVKQISLFGFSVTCSDVFAVGGVLGLNLLQEHFGKEAAKKAVQISFFSLFFFALMSQFHLLYLPTPADQTHEAFRTIFSSTPRILAASIATYFVVQRGDVWLFERLKHLFQGNYLGARLVFSLVASQFFDTILFSFLGLYGLVESLFDVIFFSFAVKCLLIACSTPLTLLSKRLIRHVSL